MSIKHHIEVSKTATFFILGNVETAKTIWYVLHGYGYAAEYFIKKFECIANEDVCIIAPEGLSRFYLEGVEGRVGASWMTKVEREHEIKDYINYLNQLFDEISAKNDVAKINVLGFSQGGATLCRWVSNGHITFNNFILWASGFSDDMDFTKMENGRMFYVYGNSDKYITQKRIAHQESLMASSPFPIDIQTFNGNHDIPAQVFVQLTAKNKW